MPSRRIYYVYILARNTRVLPINLIRQFNPEWRGLAEGRNGAE